MNIEQNITLHYFFLLTSGPISWRIWLSQIGGSQTTIIAQALRKSNAGGKNVPLSWCMKSYTWERKKIEGSLQYRRYFENPQQIFVHQHLSTIYSWEGSFCSQQGFWKKQI